VLALLFSLALAQGGEKVQEVKEILEQEIGEKVRETREKEMEDSPYDRVVALKFELDGQKSEAEEFYEKINQIEALYWQDPAWDAYTPAWAEEGSKTTVSVISTPDITSLHAGRPATYYMRYDVTYRKSPHLNGTEGFVVNSGQLVEAGSPSRDVARRTVEVTPIDWAKCMNEPFDESIRDCRFIQYLNRESCRNFSPEYMQECSIFYEWSGIIPDDAGPVIPISRTTSFIINDVDDEENLTGMFHVQCIGQEPRHKSDRRLYGLFHFPKDDTYMPMCSPCQRRGTCPPHSVCKDLGGNEYDCLCVAGYDKDSHNACVRNHTNPEILLRFKNRDQSITKMKQCGRYVEEGYDVVVGNNPDPSNRNSFVQVEYPPELAAQLVHHHGEFEVSYWLKNTTDDGHQSPSPVKRRVVVEQVDRCGLRHCGEPCPENTLCQHQHDEHYPRDIACVCYSPRQCSNPNDDIPELLPALYAGKSNASREYHNQKNAEGYSWHMPPSRCYEESGDREQTLCVDAAPPVLYYKEYKVPIYTCRVCNSSYEGGFVEPDCWFFDFHDGRPERCTWKTTKELHRINETYSVEDVTLIAKDTQGLETHVTIQLFHQVQDISVEIDELIRFRKQMRDFEAAVETILYWAKLVLFTFVVILLCWLAFTAEGMLFFRVLCRKITAPGTAWSLHEANIMAEDLFNKRNSNSPARRRD